MRKLIPISGGVSNLKGVELALSYHHMGYGNPKITNKGSDGYYIIIEFHKNKAEVFNSAVGGRSERYSRFYILTKSTESLPTMLLQYALWEIENSTILS